MGAVFSAKSACAFVAGLVLMLLPAPAGAQQWVSYTPTANQTLANVSVINGSWRATIHYTFPTSGYRVQWGAMRRSGNVFYVTTTIEKSTAARPPYITYVGQNYSMGPLAQGQYRLRAIANGQVVRETHFTVTRQSVR